ncbi:MAG: hypothetical protein ACREPD_06520 [Stenotrophomonas sp.]|uniref:hypothetical protein n=1 Tax=Stenotrophomonas sp. TaxID=69392 RepID=UPI003D6D8FA1
MAYDAAGNLAWSAAGVALTDPSSCSQAEAAGAPSRVDRTYDPVGRVLSLRFTDKNGDQLWGYWPDGLPRFVTANNDGAISTSRYTYNLRGLLTRESLETGSGEVLALHRTYDANASLAAYQYPDGLRVDYAPNALGMPTRAADFATNVRYEPGGDIAGFRYGNGVEHTLTSNVRGLAERRRDSASGAAVLDDSYDYDGNGNVVAISDGTPGSRGNRDLTYDGLDRLVAAQSPMFGSASYGYDVLDNLRRVGIAGRDHDYVYDGANRLTNVIDRTTQSTVIGLSYDMQGNLSRRNGRDFLFDHGNRLRSIPGLETYSYDGHGRRVGAVNATGGAILSFYDSEGVLRFQRNNREAAAHDYVYLNGRLVARPTSLAAPAPPVAEAPGWSTDGNFAVTWSGMKGAASYDVSEASASGTTTIYTGTALSVAVEGRVPDQYTYRVRACNAAGCSVPSNAVSTFVSNPPREPAGITAPPVGPSGNFTITWQPPRPRETGPTTYLLEMESQGAWSESYRGEALLHGFVAVPAGTYRFRVRSCNPWGCSSPVLSEATRVVYPPATPSLHVPHTNIGAQLPVAWTASEGAGRYELDQRYGGGGWVRAYTGAHTAVTLSNRLSGNYGYRLRACNEGGCSADSAEATVRVVVRPDGAPALSAPGGSHTGSYALTWNALAHVDAYVVQELVPGGGWQAVHSGGGQSASLQGRWTGAWRYRIQACNADGCGPWSRESVVDVLLPPGTPTITHSKKIAMQHMSGSSRRCRVEWSAVAHVERHELTNANGAVAAFSSAERSTSVVVRNGGFPQHVACWSQHAVRACNAAGCSAWSPFLIQAYEYIDDRP